MVLKAESIGKQYRKKGRMVLEGVCLYAEEREFLVVTGPSGSGKSTLLAIAGGYLKPTEGRVQFQGQNLFTLKDRELAEIHGEKIGYVPQASVLLKGYTLLENVLAPSWFASGKTAGEAFREKAMDLLQSLGMEALLHQYPYELSGGEQKRAALARALLLEPDLLLADEPTAGLDKETARILTEYLYAYSRKGKTVIVATHQEDVMEYGDRRLELG